MEGGKEGKKERRRREREPGIENLFEERVTEKFPNLGKEIDIQVYEAQKNPKQKESKQIHTKTYPN